MSYSIFRDMRETGGLGLSMISRILDIFRASKSDNYFDYTQVLRVTPTTIVDADLELVPYIKDVLTTTNQLVAALYLQAATLMCTVGKIDIRRHLDQLNPNRQPLDNLLRSGKDLIGESSYLLTLPKKAKVSGRLLDKRAYRYGLPSVMVLVGEDDRYYEEVDRKDTSSSGGDVKAGDTVKEIRESSNLVSGIVLSVPISDGQHEATVYPVIQLAITMLDGESMVEILDPTDNDRQMAYRWKNSRLSKSFIESAIDMVTCKDMLDKERRKILKDKTGIYQESNARMRRNFMSGVFSGSPSIAQCTSIAVINETTATRLELAMNGELSDFKVRQRIFAAGGYMMLVVVDREVDRITFYYQNIVQGNTVRPDDIKSKGGNSGGPNISEILTAFRASSAPVF